ncbi:MAG: beta-lactamase family protein [Tatlockia sp.]|nr:beta-lactamase family protein [Tatlockia sp.]
MIRLISLILMLLYSLAHSKTSSDFDNWLNQGMAKHTIPGLSIAVFSNYQLVWAKGYGYADVANKKLVTPSVLFQAGSISKPITAMAAIKAVQDGKLTLDGDINQNLQSWKIPQNDFTKKSPITLRRLLSHSGGFNVSGFIGYKKGSKLPTLVEILDGKSPANSKPIQVTTKPGQKFSYSGGGYIVVQQALIDVYHSTFTQLMQDSILAPLNMTSSSFQQPLPKTVKNFALPYYENYQLVPDAPYIYLEKAAAGLWTTPTDLGKALISIQKSLAGDKQQILTKSSAQLMTVRPESHAPNLQMGLGFIVKLNKYGKPAKEGTYFGHAGQNIGYRNLLIADIKQGNSIVIMTNMTPSDIKKSGAFKFIDENLKELLICSNGNNFEILKTDKDKNDNYKNFRINSRLVVFLQNITSKEQAITRLKGHHNYVVICHFNFSL